MATTVKKDAAILEGYSVDKADEFVTKALKGEKGQKQLLKKLYQDREEVVDNCAPEVAIQTITSLQFLAAPEGRKLAACFLVQPLSLDYAWKELKKFVVTTSPSSQTCWNIGNTVLQAWKFAEINPLNSQGNGKEEVESKMIQDMIYLAVMTPKKFAQRFAWMVSGLMGEEPASKKQNHMYFRCTQPIIWRHLDVPNEDVRVAASNMLLKFYPLRSEDEFEDAEYLQKQHDAMGKMLMDDCVTLRAEAIKKLLFHVSENWSNFPKQAIKGYLSTVVDKLSFDKAIDVRAAVYEGISSLFSCGPAVAATEETLKLIAKRGVNDKAEKVRLAACKMLNKLDDHRFIKFFNVVEMRDLLMRLDFEHSTSVQAQLVKLLFKSFCPTIVEGIDYIVRFKRIRFMCGISRNASLHFHRLIFPMKLVDVEQAFNHIRSLLLGTKACLKKLTPPFPEDHNSRHGSDESELNVTGATEMFNQEEDEQGEATERTVDTEKKIAELKDVLDSAVVLWMAIRQDLYANKNARYNDELMRGASNLLGTLENYSVRSIAEDAGCSCIASMIMSWLKKTPLIDSALVMAALLPKDRIQRVHTQVLSKIETADIEDPYFGHYLDALASWDMNKMLKIVDDGIRKLRTVARKASGIPDTPMKAFPAVSSPPSKRTRMTPSKGTPARKPPGSAMKAGQGANNERTLHRPLEFLKMFLASPQLMTLLMRNFRVYLSNFCKILVAVRAAFGELLKRNVDMKSLEVGGRTLISAYETLTMLSLIMQPEESGHVEGDEPMEIDGDGEDGSTDCTPTRRDRLLLDEIDWFNSVADVKFPQMPIVELFLRCSRLHFASGKLSADVLAKMAQMLQRIASHFDGVPNSPQEAIEKTAAQLAEALNYCEEKREKAAQTRDEVVRPIIDENASRVSG